MRKKLQVFISSTYTDLIEERQAAVSAVLKAGHIPAGMELFTAGDKSQMDTITAWIDESDVYMLILGGRYGSVEESTNLSYTELEFDYAVSQNKPMFSVVIKETALDAKVMACGPDFMERKNPKELELFRAKVLSKVSSFYEDPKDIKLSVYESMSDFSNKRELKGWISGGEVIDTQPLLSEITNISSENESLRERIKELEMQLSKERSIEKGGSRKFDDLRSVLSKIKITVPAKVYQQSEDVETDLLNIFYYNKEALVRGVVNSASGITDYRRFLYFNICPKLQIHGLVDNEKVAGVKYRRSYVTSQGMAFLAYLEKEELSAV
ncbi:DUF4062 domain-containing protein [Pseudomonas sp. B21-023]|uniref:DUF4062 domain-containing protein n=1 Tax=unclassified Pseudomonas TaxID=196821 RepID=UPI00215EC364|nr:MULTISPECIES: DUF4062 domain-containing protein [unclassified Pseudomonas]UVL20539.1 DUF4062 domain-containing protein [Pseudomonas sp. B21-044]UVM17957.1 DUF4062 domain-containing protein [Pseudomonas sp. B21-023]